MLGIWKKKEEAMASLWIDRHDFDQKLRALRCSESTRAALRSLNRTGVAILRKNIDEGLCDEIILDFEKYCLEHSDHQDYCDEYGLHDRLANLPLYSKAAQRGVLNCNTLDIIEKIFQKRADIVGSLYFERGSEQDIHRDSPAFYTVPINHYFGVWNALEDIHPDSGLLTYFPGGHRVIGDETFVGSSDLEAYFDAVVADCRRRGLKQVGVEAKKGDTVIWHPQLPHGGMRIRDRSKSRRSIVFHYKESGLPIYGADQFFGDQSGISSEDNMIYVDMDGRNYVAHGAPKFFKNKKEGNFKD